VLRLDDERALIFTTDFFTPIVDDAYQYGAIAAANALSDVYAMGGRPLLALNITAFPANLPLEMLTDILRGMAEKVREAGAVIAGGHTIQDKEPKAGLAVIGMTAPDKLLTKAGARPGDTLVLTKPLGSGLIATASKQDKANPAHLAEAVGWMTRLNRQASEAALAAGAHAMTDVTGFGLLGHASEMAEAGGVTFEIDVSGVPLMAGIDGYAAEWLFPGGSMANKEAFEARVRFEEGISPEQQMILFDAQTSGGLLIALSPEGLERFEREMQTSASSWWQIGRVAERGNAGIIVAR
jgi:selenide,water dikinase